MRGWEYPHRAWLVSTSDPLDHGNKYTMQSNTGISSVGGMRDTPKWCHSGDPSILMSIPCSRHTIGKIAWLTSMWMLYYARTGPVPPLLASGRFWLIAACLERYHPGWNVPSSGTHISGKSLAFSPQITISLLHRQHADDNWIEKNLQISSKWMQRTSESTC